MVFQACLCDAQDKIMELLTEFKELFDGTLCDWNIKPVSFELKEGTKPYHDRPFPIPMSCNENTMKELNRLCELGVLEFQPASECAMGCTLLHTTLKV